MSGVAWIVDSEGNRIPNKNKHSRSPPVYPDNYDDYKIDLVWEPEEEFSPGTCSMTCLDVYEGAAQGVCGRTGGTQNVMAMDGSWNVVCGTYSWEIQPPASATEPEASNRDFPNHKDTQGSDVQIQACLVCDKAPTEMRSDTLYGSDGHGAGLAVQAYITPLSGRATVLQRLKR